MTWGGGYFVFIFHKNPSWMSQYNVFIIFKMFTEYLKYLWSPCIYWYWILRNQSSKYTHNILKRGVTDDKHVQGSIVVWGAWFGHLPGVCFCEWDLCIIWGRKLWEQEDAVDAQYKQSRRMHVQAPASFPTSVYCHRYFWRKIISHGQAIFCKGAIQDVKSKCQIWSSRQHFATTMERTIHVLCLLDNNFSHYKGFWWLALFLMMGCKQHCHIIKKIFSFPNAVVCMGNS